MVSTMKPRCVPIELKIWRALNVRMNLTASEVKNYQYQEKGLAGELRFDALAPENLRGERLILNDLLFEQNQSTFQIDSLIINQNFLCHYEIKNNEGDHYYKSDKFYTIFNTEIKNPLHQLNRSATLLRQLLKNIGCDLPLKSYVVFINPEFTLYQAPLNQPIIYPSQLLRHFNELNNQASKLNTRNHMNLAEKLMSLHLVDHPYKRVPNYSYGALTKGMICGTCEAAFLKFVSDRKVGCGSCGCVEGVESAVLRSVEEFKLLFPELKITTSAIHEWCGGGVSKKVIRRVLLKNFRVIRFGKWTYYI